jgi:uncharacterized protein with NRDE domain
VCTVLLRFDPAATWPLLVAAVRDEFMGRPWDGPGRYWPELPTLIGGRDRVAGGTWMAVDTGPAATSPGGRRPALAALLNGVRLDGPPDRPTRGRLVLAALAAADGLLPGIADAAELAGYDGFHLVRADVDRAEIWSWDGVDLSHRRLAPGDHIIVNLGVDRDEDPLVPHFRPLFAATATPPLVGDTADAWAGWVELLRGDGLAPDDPRGLIIAHEHEGRRYGSTSASLVAIARDGRVRYDFTATPDSPSWDQVGMSD